MTNKEWFREAKFGMMIHWGLYSLLAGEYKGKRYDYNDELVKGWDPVGEWIMPRYEIPIAEYEKLAEAFNPIFFDADEWVALAKEAGINYLLNVGPDGLGRIPAPTIDILKKLGSLLREKQQNK